MAVNKNKLGGAILHICAAALLIILTDLCLGKASDWLYHKSKYGIFHRQIYLLNESNDDIIILGSSRASHHYVPKVFTDSLNMTCYNAGSEGMCIYYHYALLASMIERGYHPKLVIYDIMDLDTKEHPGPTFTLDSALERLAPHYGEYKSIDSLFMLKGWKEKFKLYSKTYRYNSKLVQSIKCNYIPSPEDNGYESVFGELKDGIKFTHEKYNNCRLDTMKIHYFRKFVNLAVENNINLILVLSPMYQDRPSKAFDMPKIIAKEKNIPFYDCINEPALMKQELFRDLMHLNDNGAHVWSAYIAHRLKPNLITE